MPEIDPRFESLLEYLRQSRGFDFAAYKRTTLARRVRRRLEILGLDSFDAYVDYLEVHPEEFAALFDTILINVTSFFRDQESWDFLAAEAIPTILQRYPEGPIRFWSAGCASGQEPYSLAMLLAEALGTDTLKDRVKIYATDVDERALSEARQASYRARAVEPIPAHLLTKYFDRVGDRFVANRDLRRSVIYGRHDLIRDAPISRVNLLICRNTLMYFHAEVQNRVRERFHSAVEDGGFLFLGRAEMLFAGQNLFRPLDLKRRVFVKVGSSDARHLVVAANEGQANRRQFDTGVLMSFAFDQEATGQLILDGSAVLVAANLTARALFNLNLGDLGRPLQDLSVAYHPADLRTMLEQAHGDRTVVSRRDVRWESGGRTVLMDVDVVPLVADGRPIGAHITFRDVTRVAHLQEALKTANTELEIAYEELQSTNEELETTNEELQSSNEELETTNEELQSTNEELETMNEELHSTNEELETANEELRRRGEKLEHVNAFLRSILASMHEGVAVLDQDMRIHAWNSRSADLWGVTADEVVGQHFVSIDIGLPVEQLLQPIKACLTGESDYLEQTLRATNRRGRTISVSVKCSPLAGNALKGAVILMQEIASGPYEQHAG